MQVLMLLCALFFLVLAALYAMYLCERRLLRRSMREFAEAFPGKCYICSYHRFGVREGLAAPNSEPPRHRCPEKDNAED